MAGIIGCICSTSPETRTTGSNQRNGHELQKQAPSRTCSAVFIPAVVRADDVTRTGDGHSLIGKLHAPVRIHLVQLFSWRASRSNRLRRSHPECTFTDRGAGLPPRTTTFSADYFFFGANQTEVLAQFGRSTTWDLMATTHSAFIIDPRTPLRAVPTPEPPRCCAIATLGFGSFPAYAINLMQNVENVRVIQCRQHPSLSIELTMQEWSGERLNFDLLVPK